MAVAISAADSSFSLVIQVLHFVKANTIWLLRVAGLASGDCRATEWIRWLCIRINRETRQADRSIPTNWLAGVSIGIDDLTFA